MNTDLPAPSLLDETHSEDIGDVLKKVEKSFNIKFGKTELKDVKTFGELCDIILSKIKSENVNDCSTQQAFYKLRNAILSVKNVAIKPDTLLDDLFPKKGRRKLIAAVEANLGFKLHILEPPFYILLTLFIMLILSLFMFLFKWQYALAGSIISLLLIQVALATARKFTINTVGEVADQMTRENYFKVRRYPKTVNRAEVAKQVEMLFIHSLALDRKEIRPETIIA